MLWSPHIFLLFSFLILGCARPIYINPNADDQSQNNEYQAQGTCPHTFDQSKYCLFWKWEVLPTETETGSIIFKVYRLNLFDQTPIQIDLISNPEVILWMPSMGHGSNPTDVTKLDTGTYRVNNVYFIMPGQWQIKFQIKSSNVVQDEVVVNFNL